MSTISGYNSNSISTLFSSLGSGSTGSNGNSFNVDLSMYSSIRSGSYKKLLTAYYKKQAEGADTESGTTTNKTDSVTMTSLKNNMTAVRGQATKLDDAANALDKYSMWQQKTTTDKDGNTKTDYDREAIYKAVSEFTSDYNSLVTGTGSSSNHSILRSAANMVNNTKANKDLLASVGITIGVDNKLSVDEKKLKNADIAVVKSIFDGSSSYGQTVATQASSIKNYAASQLSKLAATGTYTNNGSYNYASGSVYSTYL